MSATTPHPITASKEGSPPSPSPLPPSLLLARLGGPIALVVGGLLAATGMALHLLATEEELDTVLAIAADPGGWLASHLLQSFGYALVAVGAWSVLRLVRRDRGGTLTAMGIVATTFGALTMALSDMAHGAVGFALTEVDPATSVAVHEAYFGHPVVLALNTGPLLLSVGMVVLGAGLLRTRSHPRWVGVVVLLTPIAVHAAFSAPVPAVVHGVPFAIGICAFAYAQARLARSLDTHAPRTVGR